MWPSKRLPQGSTPSSRILRSFSRREASCIPGEAYLWSSSWATRRQVESWGPSKERLAFSRQESQHFSATRVVVNVSSRGRQPVRRPHRQSSTARASRDTFIFCERTIYVNARHRREERLALYCVEIRTERWAHLVEWYREVLGMRVLVRVIDDGYALLDAGETRIALVSRSETDGPSRRISLAFEVSDLPAVCRPARRGRHTGHLSGSPPGRVARSHHGRSRRQSDPAVRLAASALNAPLARAGSTQAIASP